MLRKGCVRAMYKIAFMGDRKSLTMYRPAGFSLFMPGSEADVKKIIQDIEEDQYAIIFVTEQVYRMAKETIQRFDNSFLPAIIVLPGYGEDGEEGIKRMNELIENAVGMKL